MASEVIGSLTFILANGLSRQISKETSRLRIRGIYRWSIDSPHKGSVMPKAFPLHDVIMTTAQSDTNLLLRKHSFEYNQTQIIYWNIWNKDIIKKKKNQHNLANSWKQCNVTIVQWDHFYQDGLTLIPVWITYYIIKYGMKLLFRTQTSTVQRLRCNWWFKFEVYTANMTKNFTHVTYGDVISSGDVNFVIFTKGYQNVALWLQTTPSLVLNIVVMLKTTLKLVLNILWWIFLIIW